MHKFAYGSVIVVLMVGCSSEIGSVDGEGTGAAGSAGAGNSADGRTEGGIRTGAGGTSGGVGGGGTAGVSSPGSSGNSGSGGASGAGGRAVGDSGTTGAGARGAGGARPDAGAARPDAGTTPVTVDAGRLSCNTTFPTPTRQQSLSATMRVSGTYDGTMGRFVGTGALGTSGQGESQDPLFQLADGAVLMNVILGNPAADGVHCSGSCTLQNVWWEDVGEDAATLQGTSSSQTMVIDGGGAKHAADKVFQHNGPGTMIIKNFFVSDFGKLYRSCGNCSAQFERHVIIQNVTAVAPGSALAGVNANDNDTATFSQLTLCDSARHIAVCQRYTGNDTGAEPPLLGSGADGTACLYATSDVTWAATP